MAAVAGDGVGISPRTAEVTIARWMKSISDLMVRKLPFLHELERRKKIKYGVGSDQIRWPVRTKDPSISAHVDGGAKQFSRLNDVDNAYLRMRGYESTDLVTLKEKLVNRGPAAMVKLFDDRKDWLRRGLKRSISAEWFKDGNATGNEHRFHGIESFCSVTGQTATDALQTTSNDTYASLTTAAGDSTVDPDSVKTWTPVVVNCNRTVSSSTRTWTDYADEYIRKGIIEASFGADQEDQLDMILLTKTAYEDLLNIADDKEHLHFTRGKGVSMAKFGFTQFVEWDGVPIGWDAGIPATDGASDTVYGYGFNMDYLELCLLNLKALWECKVTWNSSRAADEIYFYCLGNMRFESPRFFTKFAAIS